MDNKNPGIVYFGTDEFAVTVLEELLKRSVAVALVITTPARPAGRGLAERESAVASFAAAHGLTSQACDDLTSEATRSLLAAYAAHVFCVVSYGKILPRSLLSVSRYPVLNVHPSLLPRWRGPSPIQSTLLAGDERAGVSIIKITEEVDAGDVLAQKSVRVTLDMNALSLEQLLAIEGAQLLADTITRLEALTTEARPQDATHVTHTKKLAKADGLIDWNLTALAIHNKVRALIKWPTAFSTIGGKIIRIFGSKLGPSVPIGTAGEIIAIDKNDGIRVMTGRGAIDITEVQLEGKKRMHAFQFAIGARINVGNIFGELR